MYNTIITLCHLVADPELRQTNTGKAVCNMRVCVSGSDARDKAYIDVELWERKAEIAAQYLTKGREVLIEGALCMATWGEGDAKRSKHYIKGRDFQFISNGKKAEGGDAAAGSPSDSAPANAASDTEDDDVPF